MATNHDLINSTDAAITGWGGSAINVPARSIGVNVALTDAQAIAGTVTASAAVLKASSTAAQKAAVAGMLLDSILESIDLTTPRARELERLRNGIQQGQDVLRQVTA
jgi:hypothetical protein